TQETPQRVHRQRHSRCDRMSGDLEMTFRKLILIATIAAAPVLLAGQGQTKGQASGQAQGGLDPATIGKPLGDSWPTYSGDYTGRRYSSLTQVNQTTVKNLTLA